LHRAPNQRRPDVLGFLVARPRLVLRAGRLAAFFAGFRVCRVDFRVAVLRAVFFTARFFVAFLFFAGALVFLVATLPFFAGLRLFFAGALPLLRVAFAFPGFPGPLAAAFSNQVAFGTSKNISRRLFFTWPDVK
jgi:hypothetical protein